MPARPAWNSGYTVAEFFSTALLLGPLFVRAFGVYDGPSLGIARRDRRNRAACHPDAEVPLAVALRNLRAAASSLLLAGQLRTAFLMRLALLVAAGIVVTAGRANWTRVGCTALRSTRRRMARPLAVLRERGSEEHGRRLHAEGAAA